MIALQPHETQKAQFLWKRWNGAHTKSIQYDQRRQLPGTKQRMAQEQTI